MTALISVFWSVVVAILTVRNLPDEVHRALRLRAAQHGRSTEAEVRALLEEAVKPQGRLKLGSLLADIGRQAKLTDEEVALINQRDQSLPRPVNFE
ncbi:FitA-like ribbon-helix-helix domain-containing protein [Thermomonas flagellata]|uniref:FitA-like ribbon-helix-helix domain-containing protein n=1 Tax=Thermomonas flagellata TaxID=2888524 RepID=UPI001F04D5C1|nr:Arc family DNA-binding protein [Thermomonas flagellata]